MAKLPIKKLVMPSDLRCATNGELPRGVLRKILPSGKRYGVQSTDLDLNVMKVSEYSRFLCP